MEGAPAASSSAPPPRQEEQPQQQQEGQGSSQPAGNDAEPEHQQRTVSAGPADREREGEGSRAPELSAERQAEMLAQAEALKAEGNALYQEGNYHAASEKYADAIEAAPAPPYANKQRAVYLANLAACDIGRGDHAEALRACTAAIDEDPTYMKAYARRFNAFEALDDLDRALGDAKKVLELDPSNAWAKVSVKRLEPVVAERHEKLKNDMMGKFKDLGNTLLGKFGMSLDNFKAEKDPNTGGYSIKFQQ